MSEYLQNKEYKRGVLKRLIQDLHNGRDFAEVKREFGALLEGVEATEIAAMEQQLISEGLPPDEIKKLCDVHAALFRDALERNEPPELLPGHPLHLLKHENDAARAALEDIERLVQKFSSGDPDMQSTLTALREKLGYFKKHLDGHFSKKENIFFPYLEKHNITGPPSVMWAVDDEIRDMLKNLLVSLTNSAGREQAANLGQDFKQLKDKVTEMFFKEENILTPMMKDVLTEDQWIEIKEQLRDFGPSFDVREEEQWQSAARERAPETGQPGAGGAIPLDVGALTPLEVNNILKNLPVDITFVGADDTVRYFSLGRERVFTRTRSIIGRKVQNCHPPESVHVVDQIVNDFKTGRHHSAEFWLELNGAFIHIRYLALRDEQGRYLGTMEVSQDITKLRALEGERRLLQYNE